MENAFVILFWWTCRMQYRFSQKASDARTSLSWEAFEGGNIFEISWVQWEKSNQLTKPNHIHSSDGCRKPSCWPVLPEEKFRAQKKSTSRPHIVEVIPVVLYTLVLFEYIFVWINWFEPNNLISFKPLLFYPLQYSLKICYLNSLQKLFIWMKSKSFYSLKIIKNLRRINSSIWLNWIKL